MSVCDGAGEGSVVPGGGLPSFMLNAVANIPKGNAPIPNDIWKPPSPNPKPWNPCREQRTEDKKGNHLEPISEYFVEVQTFPLTGFAMAEGGLRCLAAFSLSHFCRDPSSSPGLKCFRQQQIHRATQRFEKMKTSNCSSCLRATN